MKKGNATCSRSPSRWCQSQNGKYLHKLCSAFWLKSNYFYATELIAPGQHDTKNSVAWTVYTENKHMAQGRCKKEFRSDSSSWFCSDVSDAREQETLWLDDMFLFNDNAEYRAGFWQSGISWKPCWLSQVCGGPCRKLSFWKSTLPEVSKGGFGCDRRYSRRRVKNDPIFLESFRSEQWTEASAKHSSEASGFNQKIRQDSWILAPPHQVWCCPFRCVPGGFCQIHSECGWLSWRWEGCPPSQTRHPPIPVDSHTVRVKYVLQLSYRPSFYLSSRSTSPQQPINPFQAHMGLHMCFLVA